MYVKPGIQQKPQGDSSARPPAFSLQLPPPCTLPRQFAAAFPISRAPTSLSVPNSTRLPGSAWGALPALWTGICLQAESRGNHKPHFDCLFSPQGLEDCTRSRNK